MRDIEKYTEEYLNTNFEQIYQVKYRRKKVLEIINANSYVRILEVGCGMDSIANYVEKYEEFTLVEPSKIFINKAKKDMKKNRNMNYINGLVEEEVQELQKRKYDFIIISSLLHEVESPLSLLNVVKLLCDDETVVHINVPNAMSLHRILARESGLIKSVSDKSKRNIELQQNNIFTLETLCELIEKSGNIEICERGSFFVKPFTHTQMESCLKNDIFNEKVLDGFYQLTKYMPIYGSEVYINYKYKV